MIVENLRIQSTQLMSEHDEESAGKTTPDLPRGLRAITVGHTPLQETFPIRVHPIHIAPPKTSKPLGTLSLTLFTRRLPTKTHQH